MNLVIAHTPTTAFAVSRALNCTDRTPDGHFTNDTMSIIIAHVPQDLVTPNTLKDYAGGSDFIKQLPFIPSEYLYHITDKKKAEAIFTLMRIADEVIFASAGGCVEQGMFDRLCQAAEVGKKRSRMFLTSLTNKEINRAYRYRKSGRGLYLFGRAGDAQIACDNLFNINFGGFMGLVYGKGSFPLHRQDTSILWTLCETVDSRKAFKPGPTYYPLSVTVECMGYPVKLHLPGLCEDETFIIKQASRLKQLLSETFTGSVLDVWNVVPGECEDLFTHESLQVEALRRLGYLPAQTNKLAMSLYEKGLISSPLTSMAGLPKRLKDQLAKRYPGAKNFPYEENSSCNYCHGIITTGRNPIFLTPDEEWMFGLISQRMEKVMTQKWEERELSIYVEIDGKTFYGSTIVSDDFYIAPDSEVQVKLIGVGHSSYTSKHPGNVVAADFLTDIYDYLDLGTIEEDYPFSDFADQGLALQRLIDNGFVKILFGEIFPTEKARLLMILTENTDFGDIGTISSYTALLNECIWSGCSASIVHKYEDWLEEQMITLITDTTNKNAKPLIHKCPKCGQETLTEYPLAISCSHCNFAMPKHFRGYAFTKKDINQLLTHRYTSPIYGFKGRKGRKYCDALVLDQKFRLTNAPAEAKIY